ncbi:MAG: hypothetical protein OEV61_07510 [Chloroflexota bacterium]|nr:hypothetical protein [Chloroflexota bacterium]
MSSLASDLATTVTVERAVAGDEVAFAGGTILGVGWYRSPVSGDVVVGTIQHPEGVGR